MASAAEWIGLRSAFVQQRSELKGAGLFLANEAQAAPLAILNPCEDRLPVALSPSKATRLATTTEWASSLDHPCCYLQVGPREGR